MKVRKEKEEEEEKKGKKEKREKREEKEKRGEVESGRSEIFFFSDRGAPCRVRLHTKIPRRQGSALFWRAFSGLYSTEGNHQTSRDRKGVVASVLFWLLRLYAGIRGSVKEVVVVSEGCGNTDP